MAILISPPPSNPFSAKLQCPDHCDTQPPPCQPPFGKLPPDPAAAHLKRMPMKILLANPRGFCAGVNMAIECVDRVLKLKGPPVYVYHEIVHNKHVVDRFIHQGVVFVNSIDEVPSGATV